MEKWTIVWHWHDLRVEDNPALAHVSSGRVLPVYIHSPEEEGSWPSGAASNWWLHHSLLSLAEQYEKLGSRLIIRSGSAEKILREIMQEVPVEAIHWNRRYEPVLRRRDEQVMKRFRREGITIETFEGNYLITPSEVLNKSGKPYSVYTPFSKVIFSSQSWRDPLKPPQKLKKHPIASEEVDQLALLPEHDWAEQFPKRWSPGRAGALAKLKAFKAKVDAYGEERDIPSHYATSRLSPHLHFGEISPHEVWKAIAHPTKDRNPFLRQLLWREFGNYFLYHHPSLPEHPWSRKFARFPWEKNPKALAAWQRGETGYPIVDAGMRELWQTGWMHNRVRMIVASFLVKDLFIHWSEGEKWFWDTLVDADLANNSLGWQWVAGCGPDAAPYFRIFNPILQGKKFDPKGDYVRRWVPELKDVPDKWIHSPWEAPHPPENYPTPIVDHAVARDQALKAYQQIK